MKRVVLFSLAGLGLILLIGWALVSAPVFGQLRASLVQGWINRSGGGVELNGPIGISLGNVVHVTAENITLPDVPGGLTLGRVEADLTLSDLLHRKIDPANIVVSDAALRLTRQKDGSIAGLTKPADTAPAATRSPPDAEAILTLLANRRISLVNARLGFDDLPTNFSFDALLANLDLQGTADGATLTGKGTLNDAPLDLTLAIARSAPLSAKLTSGATALAFTAADGKTGLDALLNGQIRIDSTDLAQTLALLRLKPVLKGKASAQATLGTGPSGQPALNGIDVVANLDSGQSARISGAIGDLRQMAEAEIAIDIRLYPLGQEPPPAALIKDLRLTSVHMALAGPLKGDTQRSMSIATNGFEVNTAGTGPAPIQLSQISRGDDGTLQVGQVRIDIGPVAAPWLAMTGSIGDLLTASGIDLQGKVAFPMATIIGTDGKGLPATLGAVAGGLRVTGSAQHLALADIDLATRDTALWSLAAKGSVGSLLPLDAVNLTLAADLKAAALLKALGQEPIDLSPLAFNLALTSTDSAGTVALKLSAKLANSDLNVDLVANNRGAGPVVTGSVTSEVIKLEDLRDGLLAASQISAQIQGKPPEKPTPVRPVTRSHPELPSDDVQDITVGVIDKDRLLGAGDVTINVSLGKLAGKSTVKGIDATLKVGGGKASLGPMQFSYGGGHFDLLATIDTLTAPDIIHLKGSTDGWDFGDITRAMRLKIPASGILKAEFDISGNRSSTADFLSTLNGTTTVRMKNGSIATSLLDLAGLGVIPWLFSKDRRGKYATITCLRAPLDFKNGVVSTREAVVETPDVQLVLYGSVNVPKKTINIAGQPRPVGKPLTRSPWPFTLSGALTNPKVKVKDGPSRLRRVDGANKMPAKRTPCVPDILQLK